LAEIFPGGSFGEGVGGAAHERLGFVGGGAGGGIFEAFAERGELAKSGFLRVVDRGGVGRERGRGGVLLAEFPDGDGDLALGFDEVVAGAATGLALLGAAAAGGVFAEDFVERTDLGEEDVAGGAAELTIGTDVVGPNEPGDELVGFGVVLLEGKEMGELGFQRSGGGR